MAHHTQKLDLVQSKLPWNLALFATMSFTLWGQEITCPYIMTIDMWTTNFWHVHLGGFQDPMNFLGVKSHDFQMELELTLYFIGAQLK